MGGKAVFVAIHFVAHTCKVMRVRASRRLACGCGLRFGLLCGGSRLSTSCFAREEVQRDVSGSDTINPVPFISQTPFMLD